MKKISEHLLTTNDLYKCCAVLKSKKVLRNTAAEGSKVVWTKLYGRAIWCNSDSSWCYFVHSHYASRWRRSWFLASLWTWQLGKGKGRPSRRDRTSSPNWSTVCCSPEGMWPRPGQSRDSQADQFWCQGTVNKQYSSVMILCTQDANLFPYLAVRTPHFQIVAFYAW